MSNETKYSEIPATACTFAIGEFEVGSNGEGAKTAPVKLVARSGKPIEHWYWGKVVHDLAGMHMHKSRLPIDYVHDSKEVIGYLNKFETESGDLVTSGALVPFKESDRATEILHKLAAGVPYEASINFGGDGIKVQEVFEGEVTEVNGYQFNGPGVVIREWPLRGVAICPYGADMNTESASAFSNNKQVFSASVVTEPEAATEEAQEMSESVEVEAKVETPEVELEQVEEVSEVVEAEQAEEAEGAEEAAGEDVAAPVEAELSAETEAEEQQDVEFSATEFARIVDAFGAEIAAQTVKDGGSYETALKLHADKLEAENEKLKAKVAELSGGTGTPAKVSAPAKKKSEGLFAGTLK